MVLLSLAGLREEEGEHERIFSISYYSTTTTTMHTLSAELGLSLSFLLLALHGPERPREGDDGGFSHAPA